MVHQPPLKRPIPARLGASHALGVYYPNLDVALRISVQRQTASSLEAYLLAAAQPPGIAAGLGRIPFGAEVPC
jgi:hypothetical protein